MARIREDADLRIGQPAGQLERIDRRRHHVVVGNEFRVTDLAQAGRITLSPCVNGGDLCTDGLVADARIATFRSLVRAND